MLYGIIFKVCGNIYKNQKTNLDNEILEEVYPCVFQILYHRFVHEFGIGKPSIHRSIFNNRFYFV